MVLRTWPGNPLHFPVRVSQNKGFAVAVPRPQLWRWGRELSAILAFMALILATNYALTALPNVKLFDLLVFVAGYTLGLRRGAAIAILSWMIYGTFNPYGPASLPLLATLMASETVYALAGALVRRVLPPERVRGLPGPRRLIFAAVALACTVVYDVATNLFTGFAWAQMAGSSEYLRWILVALFNPGALLFAAMHTGSNVAFFSLLGPALIKTVQKVRGGLS